MALPKNLICANTKAAIDAAISVSTTVMVEMTSELPSDLKPPSTVATSGVATKTTTTVRNSALYSAARSKPRSENVACSLIAHEPPFVGEGEGDTDAEQDDADRAAEADAHPHHAEGVEKAHHGMRGIRRTAARQRHDQIEQLQRADDGKKCREANGGIKQRNHDVA